jgi:predicted NAD/FAD-binding protein
MTPTTTDSEPKRIAVIGAGVAGLTAAWLLQRKHHVTVFEKNRYAGGHTNTVVLEEGPDAGTPVDTGFIVLNNKTYPLFNQLLARLRCPTRTSDMSFAFYDEASGLQYAGTGLNGLFAQRRNLVSLSYLGMLREMGRFCARSRRDLHAGALSGRTVGEYLSACRYSPMLRNCYILPMAGAIWSAAYRDLDEFPAEMLMRFWENHGLLSLRDRPTWMTVEGGSQRYVRAILADFRGRVELGASVAHVRREADAVVVHDTERGDLRFDYAVLGAHADESLRLLADPSDAERALLGAWRYQENRTVLHTDPSVMPPNRRAWASWNYVHGRDATADQPVSVTYHMNRLQGLRTTQPYFVTLNNGHRVRREKIVREILYTHPLFDFGAMASQASLPDLNGVRRTYYCGSYFGYGFHEDAVRSAVHVARSFGIDL